jgi:hypothetical protein
MTTYTLAVFCIYSTLGVHAGFCGPESDDYTRMTTDKPPMTFSSAQECFARAAQISDASEGFLVGCIKDYEK